MRGFRGCGGRTRWSRRKWKNETSTLGRSSKDELAVLRSEHEKLRGPDDTVLLFRGQPDACWFLKTTLDRKQERMRIEDYYSLIGNIKPEIEPERLSKRGTMRATNLAGSLLSSFAALAVSATL